MASSTLLDVTDQNFDAEVLKSDLPVLVDFWATWCGPCRAIAPAVESIAKDHAGKLRVVKMDVDKSPRIPTQYSVSSIPVLLVFHKGQVVGNFHGSAPKPKLEAFVKDTLTRISAT